MEELKDMFQIYLDKNPDKIEALDDEKLNDLSRILLKIQKENAIKRYESWLSASKLLIC